MAEFGGKEHKGESLLTRLEKKFVAKHVGKIPSWIETYHLTMMTLPWSALIILFSYFARGNLNWLWGVSACIFVQYLTDLFDGAVGRYRDTGLVKWGYYMDHFLDYVLLCAILIGYAIIMPARFDLWIFFILVVFAAFMVNSYLAFGATNEFKIEHLMIGPTEVRIIFIVVNTLLIFFGKTYAAIALPYVLAASLLGLSVTVYRTQRQIWKIDMENKR